MKQHITDDQWNELSDKSKIVIAKKFNKGPEDPEHYTNPGVCIRLTIGQMIEFLMDQDGNHDNYGNYTHMQIETRELALGWTDDLCDDLWEAVKETLIE